MLQSITYFIIAIASIATISILAFLALLCGIKAISLTQNTFVFFKKLNSPAKNKRKRKQKYSKNRH